MNELAILFLLLAPGGVVVIGLFSLFFAKRALQPVRHITQKANEINAQRLSDRIETVCEEDELGELIQVLEPILQSFPVEDQPSCMRKSQA